MSVGIDLGSTAIRAAVVTASASAPFVSAWNPPRPGAEIRCHRSPRGIDFRTAKGDLGGPGRPDQRARTGLLADLAAVHEWAAAQPATLHGSAQTAVVAVPAGFTSNQRSAVRAEVAAAGFTAVDLINDSVAVALASTPPDAPARTVLVVGSGYRGTEVAAIRSMRGRVWVLGHLVGGDMSGSGLDAKLMNQWLAAVPPEVHTSVVDEWDAAELGTLRAAAEQVKIRLAAGETLVASWPFPTDGADAVEDVPGVPFDAAAFAALAQTCATATAERVRQVLQETDVAIADVDMVLLNGGTATIPAVADGLATALAVEVVVTSVGTVARGAALHGARLRPSTDRAAVDLGVVVQVPWTPQSASEVALARPHQRRADPVAAARELWQRGRPGEATDDLRGLVRRAQDLLAEIERGTVNTRAGGRSAPWNDTARQAGKRLRRAEAHLAKNKLFEAVSEAHQAWEQDVDDQEVFQRMLDIHVRAAATAPGPERFADAMYWLRCAHRLDRDAPDVLDALVTRLIDQARHHTEAGDRAAAKELLGDALDLDPDHAAVRSSQADLG